MPRPLPPIENATIRQIQARAAKDRAIATYYNQLAHDAKIEAEWEEVEPYNLRVYDFSNEVTEKSARKAINTLEAWGAKSNDRITFRIVSPGGDVIAGLAVYDFIVALRNQGVEVDTVSLGWAASMGSILLQAGSRRYMGEHSSMLIHQMQDEYPWSEKLSDAKIRLKFNEDLDKRMNLIMAERSVMSAEQIHRKYQNGNWWLTAEECVEYGFADDIWQPE